MRTITPKDKILGMTHEEKFFSGTDTKIFFESIAVPEISSLSYRVFQNHRPVYSYASYNMDALMVGNRIIQGQFTMVFRDAMRMRDLLADINELLYGLTPDSMKRRQKAEEATSGKKNVVVNGDTLFDSDAFLEVLLQHEDWESVVNAYKTQIFGQATEAEKKRVNTKYIPKYIGTGSLENSRLLAEGFTMYLVYDIDDIWYNQAVTDYTSHGVPKSMRDAETKYTNIKDVYAQHKAPGTVRVLDGVRIVGGPDVEVDQSGIPIQEVFSFIASDIDLIHVKGRT